MSVFLKMLSNYSRSYQVSRIDQVRLLACWPILKLRQYESHRQHKAISAVAGKILDLFKQGNLPHQVFALDGTPVTLELSLERVNFHVFTEIFWQNEYAGPFDISKVKTFVDIGANIGMASLFFLLHAKKVDRALLVEANPFLIPKLKETLAVFWERNIISLENACIFGGSGASIKFCASSHHTGGHVYLGGPINKEEVVDVKAVKLREMLDRHSFQAIDLLKMDVEGAEFEILKDDPEIFKRFKHLCIEIHGSPEERDHFKETLKVQGFKIFRHEQRQIHPRVEIVFGTRS